MEGRRRRRLAEAGRSPPPDRDVFQAERVGTTARGGVDLFFSPTRRLFLVKDRLYNTLFMKRGDNLINDDPQSFLAAKVIKCSSSFDHSVDGFKVASFD